MNLPSQVRIVEVGPRDGLQNEKSSLDVAAKVRLIEGLSESGLRSIECGSFVSPQWVPQMADTPAVFASLRQRLGVTYSALVPNMQGWQSARDLDIREVAVFAAASETFSKKNINATMAESLLRIQPVVEAALANGVRVRGYVSCALGCPFEGAIETSAVVRMARALFEMGCDEVSLGDTIGVGTPAAVQRLIQSVAEQIPVANLAVHFHDTYGQALANVLAALDKGVAVVDASVAGLGGCPYAPGAAGNLATEDLVYMLDGMGITTGVDLAKLVATGREVCDRLGHAPQSKVSLALA